MKRITKVRTINSIIIALLVAVVILGLFSPLYNDGKNGLWEGKAFGGAIAVILLALLTIGILVQGAYEKNRNKKDITAVLKEFMLITLSYDWLKSKRKKKK